MKHVLTVLLAGGVGERLYPLTQNRAKPAVPFGGMYRIVDFTLSNCINSDCRRIQVLVQYKSHSLARHIQTAWNLMRPQLGEFIDVIPPQMRVNDSWYLGTADAIYQNLYTIDRHDPREVLLLSGDHIYKCDYRKMVRCHREAEADATIAAIEFPLDQARDFGVLEVDALGRVIGFEEKPEHPKPMPGRPDHALVSMGIYVFNMETLRRVVSEDARADSTHDFGRDIIPKMLGNAGVFVYRFDDENRKQAKYWRDVGTLDSYWEANMDLAAVDPQFNLYDRNWPMRTNLPMLPPAKFVFGNPGERFGVAVDSIVSSGCIISGGEVRRSVLSPAVRICSYAKVEESILFSGVRIGRNACVRRAIIEKRIDVPDGAVIGYDLKADARHHRVTPGGVVVVESLDYLREENASPAQPVP